MSRMFVIAEAGVNHNGSMDMATELVRASASSGADAVKFQAFRASETISASAPKAAYQLATTPAGESQLDMAKRLELPVSAFAELSVVARECGIEFMASAFDVGSVKMLASLGCRSIKVASGEITNARLLLEVARTPCNVILSTGMSRLADVEEALGVLAFGMNGGMAPSRAAFSEAFEHDASFARLRERVTLLHCTTEYPAPSLSINLNAIETMHQAFGLPVGFSDHSEGWVAAVASAARGATMLEKHITLDRTLPGPDHSASLDQAQFEEMTRAIRDAEDMLGSGRKAIAEVERANAQLVRKRLEAACDIRRGDVIVESMLAARRPARGLSAMWWFDVCGRPANRDYQAGEPLDSVLLGSPQ